MLVSALRVEKQVVAGKLAGLELYRIWTTQSIIQRLSP